MKALLQDGLQAHIPASYEKQLLINFRAVTVLVTLLGVLVGAEAGPPASRNAEALANEISSDSSIRKGLWVQFGVNDGTLTAALSRDAANTVQGLSDDSEVVELARRQIVDAGRYGTVSVDLCSWKKLSYAPDIVNLVVAEDYPALQGKGLTPAEIVRVLAPRGVALLGGTEDVEKVRSTVGTELLDCKLVSIADRTWIRLVKAPDADTGEWSQPSGNVHRTGAVEDTLVGPPKGVRWLAGKNWFEYGYFRIGGSVISANGRAFYWKRFVAAKSWKSPGSISARDAYNGIPLWEREVKRIPSDFIAAGDRLYTSIDGRTVALDAATGDTVLEFKGAGSGLTYSDGILVSASSGGIAAYDAVTAENLWKNSEKGKGLPVIAEGRLYFRKGPGNRHSISESVVCLDLKTGKKFWEQPARGNSMSYGDGVLFVVPAAKSKPSEILVQGLNAEDGQRLWEAKVEAVRARGGVDCRFAADLLWITRSYSEFAGLDPKTGEKKKELSFKPTMRIRCSRVAASSRYLFHQSMSVLDLTTGAFKDFFGGRGACGTFTMPSNGLLYQIPDACTCYPKINQYAAYSPESAFDRAEKAELDIGRLVKGPAYGKVMHSRPPANRDWPTFRGDAKRSGSNASKLSAGLTEQWRQDFGEAVTSPVISEGTLFVALPESHRVVALDARTGERKWTFITGSTVDSPPTLHKGMALFGSHDGWVYALRASDGELAWKFRAAPRERRIPVDGQLESPWPVPGSVLVEGSTLYFCAGRHSDTDGGLFLYAADPVTGVLKWDKHVDRDALMAIKLRGGFNLPKTINDVLTSDGKLLYLSTVQFDLATGDVVEKPAGHRIIAWPFGMLDDPNYGISRGAGHDGQLKEVVSTARVWRYSSNTSFYVGLGLFASAGQNLSVSGNNVYGIFRTEIYKKPHKVINLSIDHYAFADTVTGVNKSERKWRTDLAFRTAASVHAGDHVAVAGYEEETSQGMLCILDADSGKKVAEMPLKGRPIHCGLAAAADRLYLNLKEGTLICFGE